MLYDEPNHDELLDELDPVQRGHEAGERNLPRPDAPRDAHERYITDRLMQIRDLAEEKFHQIVQQSHQNEHETLSYPWRVRMDEVVKDAEHQAEQELAGDHLKHERLEMNRRRDDLARFRKDHDLHHEPSYPTRQQHSLTLFLLVVVFFGESLLNANFLASGSAQGLLGGWILAFGFSLLNIGVSFWPFGMIFLRQINHIQPVHQACGWAAGGLWFLLVVVLNLMLGHFREASEVAAADGRAGDLQIGFEAVRSFMASPLGLGETQSWLVTGLGIFFASMALYKGYRWDDPYPRYGRKYREFIAVQESYSALIEQTVAVLGDLRAEAVAAVDAVAEKVRNQPVQLGKIRKTRARSARQYNEMLERLETTGNDIVTQYREANHAVRTDDEIPACHQTPWTLGLEPATADPTDDQNGYEPVSPAELHRVHQQTCDRVQSVIDAHKTALRNPGERPVGPGPMGHRHRANTRAAGSSGRLYPVPPPDKPPAPPGGQKGA